MHALPMLIVSTLLAGAPATGADLENAVLDFSATWCGPCQQVSPLVARLERAGLPIHKIDVDQNQALAAKYGVSSIPAFLVVINGKVVERQVGVQSEQALREMCRKVTQAKAAQPSRPQAASPPPKAVGRGQSPPETPQTPALVGQPFPATVRIRVKDPSGDDVGTGTIIHNADGRSLVLTCGHLFKNWDEKQSRLQIEVFEKGTGRVILGRKLAADLAADVALISIPSDKPLPSCTLAARGTRPTKGTPLVSVGCNGGAPPTVERHKVVALNRYTGPDNLECTGIPVRGRSGGGLFTQTGEIVGVCMAEDPNYKDGMYAGLEPVYRLLDRLHLTSLFPSSDGPAAALASNEEAGPDADTAAESLTAELDSPPARLPVDEEPEAPAGLGDEESEENDGLVAEAVPTAPRGKPTTAGTTASPDQLLQRALRQSRAGDIVCVIPARSGAPADATVLVIHDPSEELRRTLAAGPGAGTNSLPGVVGMPPVDIRRASRDTTRMARRGENAETELPDASDWEEDDPRHSPREGGIAAADSRFASRSGESGFQPVPRSRLRDADLGPSDDSMPPARSGRVFADDGRGAATGDLPAFDEQPAPRGSAGTFRRGRPMSLRPVTPAE
jgi:thioredoxin